MLNSGQELGPIDICYETYGTLNNQKNNAILVCHALSGDAHAAGEKGWWDIMIGPGKPIDTDTHFVICANVLGGCKGSTGPSSINPDTNKPYALSFPVITIEDMVNVQKALIDQLDINTLKAVIGGSMGGMQAIQWAISYPEAIESCIPIAATPKLSPQALAFDAVGRQAIIGDPNWNNGDYYDKDQPELGLAIARMIGHITYISEEAMNQKFGRKLQQKKEYGYDFSEEFQVESYLKYQGHKFVSRFDPNAYLFLTKALSYFDLEKTYGSLENALKKVSAKCLVIAISSDWLYTPKDSKDIVKALMKLNKEVTYCEIKSDYGHDTFLIDTPELFRLIRNFLAGQKQ